MEPSYNRYCGKRREERWCWRSSQQMSSAYHLSVPEIWTKYIEADSDIAGSVPDHINEAKIAIKWIKNNYIKKLHTVL